MATAKSKMVIAGVLLALLLGGGIVAVVFTARHFMSEAKPAIVPVMRPPTTRPWQELFTAYYALQPGEYIRRVFPDFVPGYVRLGFFQQANPPEAKDNPRGPSGMTISWTDGKPRLGLTAFGRGGDDRLPQVVHSLLDVSPAEIEGDAGVFDMRGDISYAPGATEEQYLSSLEKIAAGAGHKDVHLSLRKIDKTAIVFSGTWNYKAVNDAALDRWNTNSQPILIYTRLPATVFLVQTAGQRQFAGYLETRLPKEYQLPVLFEGENVPERMRWLVNRDANLDGKVILDHIAEQTGLTWKEEVRGVRCLVVEKG
jgi:hypothetical protein